MPGVIVQAFTCIVFYRQSQKKSSACMLSSKIWGRMTMSGLQTRLLHRLARLYGVETSYLDYQGTRRQATPESLLAALRALGAPLAKPEHLPGALRETIQRRWQRTCEPVVVAWEGKTPCLELRLPGRAATGPAGCRLQLEDGRELRWSRRLEHLPGLRSALVEGEVYTVKGLPLPSRLPEGYHRLTLDLPGSRQGILIISAPLQSHTSPGSSSNRTWGVFLPLYALRTGTDWGTGDLSGLQELLQMVQGLGGSIAGTLPLLASYLDEPFAPSPYQPVSRLFWNEFYLDVTRSPEFGSSTEARALFDGPAFQAELASLKAAPLVDYKGGMRLKRRVLEACLRHLLAGGPGSGRLAAFRRWAGENPSARDYARFRAAVEKQRALWPEWPERLREGTLQEGDYELEAEQYHLYVQWLAREQFQDLSAWARQRGLTLYLDFPLGVHGGGYDVWRWQGIFAREASSGAPPDRLFSGGQDWHFPPLHPERLREQGYRYYIACLRHHLRHAGILRLDHVMGLHHLYWIPAGLPATEGVYVRYRSEELYAILTLESRRSQSLIVGEDLGTVPGYVRRAMARHQIQRMYILPFETTGDAGRPLRPVPPNALAALNTHDMPPFAAYWQSLRGKAEGLALSAYLYRRGLLETTTQNTRSLLRGCLAHLAASRARVVLVNLEDLWLETEPQNVPGTLEEYPNWRRKARYTLEEISRMPEVLETLAELNRLRNRRVRVRPRRSLRLTGKILQTGREGSNHHEH